MKIFYFAAVKERLSLSEEDVQINEVLTIGDFSSRHLANKFSESEIKNLRFAVNEVVVDENSKISNEDTIAVFSPFSGG